MNKELDIRKIIQSYSKTYSKSAIKTAIENIVNIPIVRDDRAIGLITNVDGDGILWLEITPVIVVNEIENNTIVSFEIMGININ